MMTNWGYHHAYLISSWLHKWLIISHSWLLGPFWIHFRDRNRHLTHLSVDPEILSTFLSSISLLIVLIPSFFYWIVDLFSILLSIVLHHISGVSSFDFAPEGVGWLHHWTKFQLDLNLIAWGIWLPSYVLVTWGISSLGASCPPLSDIFVISSSFEHIYHH